MPLQAEEIKLSKVAKMLTSIARKGKTFVYVIKVLVNYAGAPYLQYKVSFEDVWMKDVFEDTMSSVFLLTRVHTMYTRCVLLAKFLLRNVQLPHVL